MVQGCACRWRCGQCGATLALVRMQPNRRPEGAVNSLADVDGAMPLVMMWGARFANLLSCLLSTPTCHGRTCWQPWRRGLEREASECDSDRRTWRMCTGVPTAKAALPDCHQDALEESHQAAKSFSPETAEACGLRRWRRVRRLAIEFWSRGGTASSSPSRPGASGSGRTFR